MSLNPREQLFADYWLVDQNGTQAAIKAGYTQRSAHSQASALLKRPKVAAYIEQRQSEKSAVIQIDRKWVLDRWSQLVTTDPSTLAATKLGACRFCHGVNHRYQWTQGEWEMRCMEAERDAERNGVDEFEGLPDPAGGFGYTPKRDPHPDCPECFGEGVARVVVGNSKGNPLYAGAKKTKDGIEIKTHDQMAALNNIAKNLGLLDDRVQLDAKVEVSDKSTRDLAIAAMALFRKTIEGNK
jgi:phage terminase small subunit